MSNIQVLLIHRKCTLVHTLLVHCHINDIMLYSALSSHMVPLGAYEIRPSGHREGTAVLRIGLSVRSVEAGRYDRALEEKGARNPGCV